jgi:hypothetical protein
MEETRFIGRVSRFKILCNVAYWGGTIVCNVVGIRNLSEAGNRAARLAVLHLVPLLMTTRLSLAADLLGMPLNVYTAIHRTAGWMVIAQSILHMIMIDLTTGIRLADVNHRSGLIVGPAPS